MDWEKGIGLPAGYFINESMRRRGAHAQRELGDRILRVQANPSEFSDYTVQFVDWLAEGWPGLATR
jgi:hypothetical protein